jgi:MFS family permease
MPRSVFFILFVALVVTAAGNTAMQTVLPAVSRALNVPDILIGVVFSVSALLWTFSASFWAQRAETRGRRALMQIGVAGFTMAMLGGGIALLLGLRGLVTPLLAIILFALFRCSYGLFGSAANPAAQAYVATRTTGAERTAALSKLSASFAIGTVLGPALAPFLILPWATLAAPLLCFALIGVATILAIRHIMPPDAPGGDARIRHEPAAKISWLDRRVMPFLILSLFIGHAQAIILQIMGFLIIDRLQTSPTEAQSYIGAAFMAGAIATVAAQWGVIPNFRLSPRHLLRWGCVVVLLGAGLMTVAENYGSIVIGFAVVSLGFGLVRPGFTAGASLAVRRDEQDSVAGAVTAVNGVCYVAGPSLGIALYHLHFHAPFFVCAAVALGLLAYLFMDPVLKQLQDEAPDADDVTTTFD